MNESFGFIAVYIGIIAAIGSILALAIWIGGMYRGHDSSEQEESASRMLKSHPLIRLACPVCRTVLQSDRSMVGNKIQCLNCGQRLQIPISRNKTILAVPPPPDDYDIRRSDLHNVEPHRGGAILTFGILSLFTIPFVFGPMAWIMGNADLRKMREGWMDREGQSLTDAGRICGMIATIFLVIIPLILLLLYLLMILCFCGLLVTVQSVLSLGTAACLLSS